MIRPNGIILLYFIFSSLKVDAQADTLTTINGTITDHDNRLPLASASIRLIRQSTGTLSDDNGKFTIRIPSLAIDDTLIVSYIGYQTVRLSAAKIKAEYPLQIELKKDTTLLHEVLVFSEFWRKQYTPEELQTDYRKFYTIMEKVHTGLFDYLSEQEWIALKDSSLQLCKYPMTHREFYQLIAWHVGKVRNMHTKHGVTDWWYRVKQHIFPFNVRYFGDRLYVSESLLSDLIFPKGSEIISINGKTPGEIKSMVWPFIPADGFNETGKMAMLNDYFPWYFSLFVEEAKSYSISIKPLHGEAITIVTSGLYDSFRSLSFRQVWKWKRSALELKMNELPGTAYFRIEDSRVFRDSIQLFFQRIRDHGIKYLIIDLRGNGGIREEEQVAELYSYLADKPFRVYERIEVKSNDYTVFDRDFTYKPYATSRKQIKERYLDRLTNSGTGYFLWEKEPYLGMQQPASITFKGTVYVLTDGRNYSASTDFTSLAAQLGNVFIVGEETGGEYRSYISGAMYGLTLPNSKIGVKIATWKSILAIEENPSQRGRGVFPDYPVSLSLEDFIGGNDTVLKLAYELIRNQN